jgi:cytochrome P450
LIDAKDKETGEQLSDQQLLDEAMAILLAGHGSLHFAPYD